LRDAPRRRLNQLRRESRGAHPRVWPRRNRGPPLLGRVPRGDRAVLLDATRALARVAYARKAVTIFGQYSLARLAIGLAACGRRAQHLADKNNLYGADARRAALLCAVDSTKWRWPTALPRGGTFRSGSAWLGRSQKDGLPSAARKSSSWAEGIDWRSKGQRLGCPFVDGRGFRAAEMDIVNQPSVLPAVHTRQSTYWGLPVHGWNVLTVKRAAVAADVQWIVPAEHRPAAPRLRSRGRSCGP
jgi:hypothetical protein